jgi:hydroxymethylbilane synthase
LRAIIVRPDGSEMHETRRLGSASDAQAMGIDAGAELKRRGGAGFFAGG